MTEPDQVGGQADAGLPEGTTGQAPEGGNGQSVTDGQTTGNGPDTTAEDSFFDPKAVPEQLMPAYKQLQAAYTKKTQSIAAHRQKIQAYEQFERDPHGTMQQIAQAYGYQLVQRGQQPNGNNEKWEPQTWDDVMSRAKQEAKAEIMKEFEPVLKPVFDEVKNLRKVNIEKSLDDIDPQWRMYESDMTEALAEHPTLVKDPMKLYRMSVPPEHIEARAMKQAMEKLKGKASSAQVSGGSTTTQRPSQSKRASNFQEAVELAKQRLQEQGLRRPGA